MIQADQPLLSDNLTIAVSSRHDGTMLDRTADDWHGPTVVANRRVFCNQVGIVYDDCVYQVISYGSDVSYDIIREVSVPNSDGVHADVLYTETPQLGLFLPVADCVATVIYDSSRHALALAHLGRHASMAKTMTKAIRYFVERGSRPGGLAIWMAPSVSASDYVMEYFDHMLDPDWAQFADEQSDGIHLDLAGYNAALAVAAGVPAGQITRSLVNTATDTNYFSHSQGDTTGRFAVVAQMR